MTDESKTKIAEEAAIGPLSSATRPVLRVLGWIGVAISVPFFLWVPAALISPLPSMVDVFGIVGLRIPASITIGGLLLAAIGFHKF